MKLLDNSTGLFLEREALEIEGLKLESAVYLCFLYQFERTTRQTIYASNKYLADKLEISEAKLSRLLKELEDFNLIKRTIIRDEITKEVKERRITTAPFLKLIQNRLNGIITDGEQHEQHKREIPKEQPKKTENKDKPKQTKETENIPYEEIVSYLNEKMGKRYSSKKAATQKDIKGRFNEGYSLEDFKTVIDNKVHEWLGTDMEKYLRPSTLFVHKHFDDYLNQGLVPKQKKSGNNGGQATNQKSQPEPRYKPFDLSRIK